MSLDQILGNFNREHQRNNFSRNVKQKANESFSSNGEAPVSVGILPSPVGHPQKKDQQKLLSGLLPNVSCDAPKASQPDRPLGNSFETCSQCGGSSFWLAGALQKWFCESCKPPPSASLVADRRSGTHAEAVTMVEKNTFVVPRYQEKKIRGSQVQVPAVLCPLCKCALRVESVWSDGSVDHHCWTCLRQLELT